MTIDGDRAEFRPFWRRVVALMHEHEAEKIGDLPLQIQEKVYAEAEQIQSGIDAQAAPGHS